MISLSIIDEIVFIFECQKNKLLLYILIFLFNDDEINNFHCFLFFVRFNHFAF